MKALRISNGALTACLRFLVADRFGHLVIASMYERSKTKVQGICSGIMVEGTSHRGDLRVEEYDDETERKTVSKFNAFHRSEQPGYKAAYTNFYFYKDRANLGVAYSDEIGKKYLLTTEEDEEEDVMNALLNNFDLPLLKEWVPYIIRKAKNLSQGASRLYATDATVLYEEGATISLKQKEIPMGKVRLVTLGLDEKSLEKIISEGLKRGDIKICRTPQKPLDLGTNGTSLDAYMMHYGRYLQKSVDEIVEPLIPLTDKVEGFVAKTKRIYPQQAAVINGAIALKRNGGRYSLLNCGMGCGKTLMAIGTVEGYFNQNWLKQHPGSTLKDMYLSPKEEQPKYRAIIMAPGHLVEKWKREILREVPGAKAVILNDLAQLDELRRKGIKPQGREYYILSKDFCKLGSADAPIPVNVGYQYIETDICAVCYEDGQAVDKAVDSHGHGYCPRCGNTKRWRKQTQKELDLQRGLICPNCNRLLISSKAAAGGFKDKDGDEDNFVLKPKDFNTKKSTNSFCNSCGAPLWGANCRPVGSAAKKAKWVKVSHFANWSKKNRKTGWVLRGHEMEYFYDQNLVDPDTGKVYPEMDARYTPAEYSPRKVAPATFIKKYMKGYWDFVILDECHKYAGAGTAQSRAAHALVKTGRFTLGLTGTLSNGKADSMYYLMWMLDPRKMKEKGFSFGSSLDFSSMYGCVETVYEGSVSDFTGEYASASRGRQLTPPRTKPGINPVVYSEFLLPCAEMMDLSDMTKYMPELKEMVEVIDLPPGVQSSYNNCASTFKEAIRQQGGNCLLGAMLDFCLSYPDKPYGRNVIMHPKFKDAVVLTPPSMDQYRSKLLPKEERMVEIIKKEISENRNVFVFANYTGKEESNITDRLKGIIEKECLLKGQVDILRADTPEALKREAYIHKRAQAGVRVVITNAKVCETGLDFCFEVDGVFYNYPTIIFMQPTSELAVMMQASRRHYRLNQTEECRTYWMAYSNTLQAAALQLMATKQVAAAAIQGKFSAAGLASMAQGVDPRIMLAQKLAEGDNSSKEELSSMFDVLAATRSGEDEDDKTYEPPMLYFELMGEEYVEEETEVDEDMGSLFAFAKTFTGSNIVPFPAKEKGTEAAGKEEPAMADEKEQGGSPETSEGGEPKDNILDFFSMFDAFAAMEDPFVTDTDVIPFKKKKKLKPAIGQMSLF